MWWVGAESDGIRREPVRAANDSMPSLFAQSSWAGIVARVVRSRALWLHTSLVRVIASTDLIDLVCKVRGAFGTLVMAKESSDD
jgi:hypothetical protein